MELHCQSVLHHPTCECNRICLINLEDWNFLRGDDFYKIVDYDPDNRLK